MRYQALLVALLALTSTTVAFDLGNQPPADPPRQGGDTIEDAIPITIPGTTDGYTNDYDEACPFIGTTAPDVVYTVTPAADIAVDIDLCYSSYDTKLYVYDENLNLIACTTTSTPAPTPRSSRAS